MEGNGKRERSVEKGVAGRKSQLNIPTKQLSVNYMYGEHSRTTGKSNARTWTASAVLPTPPSPRTATLQLSISKNHEG